MLSSSMGTSRTWRHSSTVCMLVGLFPLSVRLSRWIRTDPETLVESDAGPRIDIELFRQARAIMLPKVQALQAYVDASPYVVRLGPQS